jgi:hypothetical protein
MTPKDSRVACVKKCLKNGATAVLVVGDKIYKIANQKDVVKYAGEDVAVDGTVTGDTIQVSRVGQEGCAPSLPLIKPYVRFSRIRLS